MALRLALVQHDVAWERRDETLALLTPRVAAAAATGARLIVLSELFATGFSMDLARTAEPDDGPTTTWLRDSAARYGVWLCGTVPVRPPGEPLAHNTFVLAGPGDELHHYRKIHPFTYGGERDCFAPGDRIVSVNVDGVRVTPFVCYDLRFGNVFWEAAASTDLYVVPANWPEQRRRHWTALLTARAIENQAYVAGCNRVGKGGGLFYSGDSRVVSPLGEVLVAASEAETTLICDVDPVMVAETRARFPFQADRISAPTPTRTISAPTPTRTA